MKCVKTMVATVALAALLVPAVVVAQPGMGPGRDAGPGPIWERLDLTDAQQERMQELRREHRQAMVRLRGEIAQARAEMQALMLDPEVDEGAALAAQARVQEKKAQAARMRLEHRFAVRELLTPEQQQKMARLRAERPGRGGPGACGGCDGHGRGGRGGCDGRGPHGPRGGFRR